MTKPYYILKEEEKLNVVFSQIFVDEIKISDNFSTKLETVYFSKELDNTNYKEIIYKGSIPLYLSLENIEGNNYRCTCYFEPKNYEKVKIFLNSIKKSQKNANTNNTRTQIQNQQ